VLAGRTFDDRDRDGSERTAIVSASFAARAWPNGDAVGRRIGWATFDEPITVIGVAGDVRVTPAASPRPHVYLPYRQVDGWLPQGLAVRSDLGPAATIEAVSRIVTAIDPLQPVSGIARFEQVHEDAMGRRRFQLALFSAAAVTAVLLALGGIYGVLSYAGSQMSPELGLRLALGASRAGLLWHVMRVGLMPALLGVLLGTLLAWWSGTLLRGILYQADPRDPGTLAAAAALLTAASMAACLAPAWRAAKTDPLITMRAQ
jgi:putative ABC transport system permease protein